MTFDFMLYPTFEFIEQRGQFFPNIHLPDDFQERIPRFYEQGRKQDIEDCAKTIEQEFLISELEIRLNWHEKLGLTNISVGPSGGLDLDERAGCFQEHNLGTRTSIASGFIAMKYISELLKS